MKVLGIQIKSNEAILVVLELNDSTEISQTEESTKFTIVDIYDSKQVRRFRDQINIALDTIKPKRIGIYKRNENGKGKMAPSPVSFKLEGLIQLYDKVEIEFVAPQTLRAFFKRNTPTLAPKNKYQQDAFDVAYFMIKQ